MGQTAQQVRVAIARHVQRHSDDVEGERRLRAKLAEIRITEFVEKVVAASPPLPAESADRIAALLRGPSDDSEAA